jgi:hypothetical protein
LNKLEAKSLTVGELCQQFKDYPETLVIKTLTYLTKFDVIRVLKMAR